MKGPGHTLNQASTNNQNNLVITCISCIEDLLWFFYLFLSCALPPTECHPIVWYVGTKVRLSTIGVMSGKITASHLVNFFLSGGWLPKMPFWYDPTFNSHCIPCCPSLLSGSFFHCLHCCPSLMSIVSLPSLLPFLQCSIAFLVALP